MSSRTDTPGLARLNVDAFARCLPATTREELTYAFWTTLRDLVRRYGPIRNYWLYIEHIAVSLDDGQQFNVHKRDGHLFS